MPDERRVVVSNTTPLIALSIVEQLPLLRDLYQEILIPPAVQEEVLRGGSRAGVAELKASKWIRVVELRDPGTADFLSDLDRGEAEVIALALESTAEAAILDEKLARKHARRLGVPLTGTLGVLLRAKKMSLISQIRPLVERIRRGGIRLSDAVIEEALRLADE